MGEDKRRGDTESGDWGPGATYMPFVQMEDILDKLKLLNYESEICKNFGIKPLSKHYFALPTNSGEQFYYFTSIAAWLIRLCGKSFDQPQEDDDPNSTISIILDNLKQMLSPGHYFDFPPSKLKSGSGEYVIYVLDKLTEEALKHSKFSWKKTIHHEEDAEEEVLMDDNAEVTLDKIEEMMAIEEDDYEDDEQILDLESLKNLQTPKVTFEIAKPDEILESTVDAAEWKLEVERVLPSLKVTIRTDNKDWRSHLEQMHHHRDGISQSLTETQGMLDKLQSEITRNMEKITSREKYLNNQLEHQLQKFRSLQDSLAQTKEQYKKVSRGVTDRSRTLAQISEELEQVKQEMEERGSSMTDGAPLVKIKQALSRLKQEINQMDIRIGVVEHILLQAKLQDKSTIFNWEMNPQIMHDEAVYMF